MGDRLCPRRVVATIVTAVLVSTVVIKKEKAKTKPREQVPREKTQLVPPAVANPSDVFVMRIGSNHVPMSRESVRASANFNAAVSARATKLKWVIEPHASVPIEQVPTHKTHPPMLEP